MSGPSLSDPKLPDSTDRFRARKVRSKSAYCEIIPMLPSQVSPNCGHAVTGNFVRRSPKRMPAVRIQMHFHGNPAFLSAI